jgi:hypothetical protein
VDQLRDPDEKLYSGHNLMSNIQAAHRMSKIILPGDNREEFLQFVIVTLKGVHTAMVKFPKSLTKPFEKPLQEKKERELLWFLTDRHDELDENDENDASRYQLRGFVFEKTIFDAEDFDPKIFLDDMEKDSLQDGYVYFPKAMRDGRHEDKYVLQPIEEDHFRTRTERGMFEEVAWSPFGSIGEATKQEAQNLDRNPLLRNWV